MLVTLNDGIMLHEFSDGSGMIVFDTHSGETVGLAATLAQLSQWIVSGELEEQVDPLHLPTLGRMLNLSVT